MKRALSTVVLVIAIAASISAGALIATWWPLGGAHHASAAPGRFMEASDPSAGVPGVAAAEMPVTAPEPSDASAHVAGSAPAGDASGAREPGVAPEPTIASPNPTTHPARAMGGKRAAPGAAVEDSPGERSVTSHSPGGAPAGSPSEVAAADRIGITQAIAVLDRRTGQVLLQAEPDRPFPSMSLVKLFIAVDLLDRAGGPDHLDAKTHTLLWRMITESDDAAADRLWITGGDGAIVQRIARRYGLTGAAPPSNPGMWGDTTVTAAGLARFLSRALTDPDAGPWLAHAMRSATDVAADGFDQNFGANAVTGAGSKQGWGCCLRGVRSLDSAGFTADRVVVVLSTAAPSVGYGAMRSALTRTVRAALER